MTKEEEMREAIKNFHKVYYEIDNDPEGAIALHHAAEHLFNAAEIDVSLNPNDNNCDHFTMATLGLPPPEDLKEGWKKIREGREE